MAIDERSLSDTRGQEPPLPQPMQEFTNCPVYRQYGHMSGGGVAYGGTMRVFASTRFHHPPFSTTLPCSFVSQIFMIRTERTERIRAIS